MWETFPREVLVAVESTDCDAALLFAADEARRRRCGVHLVHVVPPVHEDSPAAAGSLSELGEELFRKGSNVLRETAEVLKRELRDDNLRVSTELCRGAVVPALLAESSHGCVVVVQRRSPGADQDTPALSAMEEIAARARAPVITVPADWRPPPPIRTPVVTVGIQDLETSAEVARMALEHAHRADARLRLVHAYNAQRAAPGRFTASTEPRRLRTRLRASFAELLTAHPEVPVEITVSKDAPDDALLGLAMDSSLLVVGRRHPRLPVSPRLGPVARSVLRGSPVPVLVVDPAPEQARRADHTALARATIS